MQEQFGDGPVCAPGREDTLDAAVPQRKRQLARYVEHRAAAESAANAIRQLTGAYETGIAPALAILSAIERQLDLVHGCLTGPRCMPDLAQARATLDALLGRSDDFSGFMLTGDETASPRLQALQADLNALWYGFQDAARAAAHQF